MGGNPCPSDGNVCTNDLCNATGTCTHPSNTAPCDDGIFCDGADTCANGSCSAHSGNPCTTQCRRTCQEAIHSCFDPSGTLCSDGDACTLHDVCNGAGSCVGQTYTGDYLVLAVNGKVVMGQGTRSDTEQTAVNGHVCSNDIRMRKFSKIGGNAVALRSAPTASPNSPAILFQKDNRIGEDCLTAGGWLKHPENVTVGGRTDTSGNAPEIAECVAAGCRAGAKLPEWENLPATTGLSLAPIRLRLGKSGRIPATGTVGSGRIVIDTPSIFLGNFSTLTLAGDPTTDMVIFRVHGRMRFGRPAKIVLEGLQPEQVIFLVDRGASFHSFDIVPATVFAAGDVNVGLGTAVDGAVIAGGRVTIGNHVRMNHHPFMGW